MRNNAQGHIFEDAITRACKLYAMQGKATVDKTPEPFRVLHKQRDGIFTGRFTALAQPDFQGTLNNGQSIVFEAKYTTTDRISRNVLTQEQQETLEAHHLMGAQTAVVCGIQSDFFRIPWVIWRDMKQIYGRQYLQATDIEQYRIKFDGAVRFLDYIGGKKPMKIACDKCLKVEDADKLEDWLKVRTDHSEFWLCPHCADGFWMAVDNGLPPIVKDKSKAEWDFAPESEVEEACRWISKTVAESKQPCGSDGEKAGGALCKKCWERWKAEKEVKNDKSTQKRN
jgi:recombination protein U